MKRDTQFSHQGVSFELFDPDDSVAAETFSDNGYEPSVMTFLRHLSKMQDIRGFIDIGSHYGYYCAYMRSLSRSCEIHAFEPGSEQLEVLKTNDQNLGLNLNIHQVALSDHKGKIEFFDRTIKIPDNAKSYSVESITYDEYAQDRISHPDIVKIDVHGAEGCVLAGMAQSLPKIKHLLVEVHAQHLCSGLGYEEIITLLEDSGFMIYEMVNFRHDIDPHLILLSNTPRASFVSYSKWTEEQISRERMIYATR